jgi:hypothetical protein
MTFASVLTLFIEFKTMWADIKIPDETDLPRELENGKCLPLEKGVFCER